MAKKKTINKVKNNNKQTMVSTNELTNLIKIIVIVCIVLLAFYFITVLVNKNSTSSTNDTDDTVAIIQYEKIMVGQILNRAENEYYVLVEKENDVNTDLYKSYTSIYSGKDGALNVYTVDLSEVFNLNYVGEETVIDSTVANLRFNDTTLIKVNNGIIETSFIGVNNIEEHLKQIIK